LSTDIYFQLRESQFSFTTYFTSEPEDISSIARNPVKLGIAWFLLVCASWAPVSTV